MSPNSVKLTITSNHWEQLKPHLEIFAHHFFDLVCLSQSVSGSYKLLQADRYTLPLSECICFPWLSSTSAVL